MSALAIVLVLISALFHALRSLFTKESGDKQIFLWLYSIVALLFFSPLFCFFLYREEPEGRPLHIYILWDIGDIHKITTYIVERTVI